VDLLTFTGSTATGKRLLVAAGQSNMKRLILECGGKSPQIVFADAADLDAVAEAVVTGITFNSGQVCTAGSRLLVERSVHEALLERVLARAAAIRAGDPLDEATTFGPLASAAQRDRVRGFVESGLADGANAVLDGSRELPVRGCYWLPTVFAGAHPRMRIAREEIFGPVLAAFPFEGEDEAVSLANATPFGLAATVWSADLARGLRLSRRIRSGSVSVVAGAVPGQVDATAGAFEPHGQSGMGIEGGLEGMRAFTRLKSVALSG
jgi:acyl-CoA reductase-like NAD-dependent aldehyde dehydrogenase